MLGKPKLFIAKSLFLTETTWVAGLDGLYERDAPTVSGSTKEGAVGMLITQHNESFCGGDEALVNKARGLPPEEAGRLVLKNLDSFGVELEEL